MKTIGFCVVTLIVLAASPAQAMRTLYAQAIVPAATAAQPQAKAGFEESSEWGKIGETLQSAWLDAKKSGDMSKKFRCFVRTRSPFDPGDSDFLQGSGFNVQMVAGNIVRGNVTAANLQEVAKLYFVRKINLATKD